MLPLAPPAPLTSAECVRRFDRALLTSDGALLRSVMHPKIVRNSPATGAGLTTYLKTIFWPALSKPLALGRDGRPVSIRSRGNVLHFVFQDAAGWGTEIRNAGDPRPVFTPVVTKTPEGARAVTDYAALSFFAAYARSNSPKRNGYQEMQDAQTYLESIAPRLTKLAIRGGSDGWRAPFRPWSTLLPEARKELDRMKPPR